MDAHWAQQEGHAPAVGCGLEHLIDHPHPPGCVLDELRQLGNLSRGEMPILHLTSIASLEPTPPNGPSASLVIAEGQMVATTPGASHATGGIPEDRLPHCVQCAQIAGRPGRSIEGCVLCEMSLDHATPLMLSRPIYRSLEVPVGGQFGSGRRMWSVVSESGTEKCPEGDAWSSRARRSASNRASRSPKR